MLHERIANSRMVETMGYEGFALDDMPLSQIPVGIYDISEDAKKLERKYSV